MRFYLLRTKEQLIDDTRENAVPKLLVLLPFALFAISAALHVFLGNFPKSIDVMPDELRYLDTARSLFAGEGLQIHGEPSSFQKILYPIALFPALYLSDPQAQIAGINVLNSLYAASAVFPAYLLARRLFNNPFAIAFGTLLAALIPDTMYSMTFMTESVFLPLALWLVYLSWRSFGAEGGKAMAMALGAGFLCYLVYLCKEVAWMFLIAFLVWVLVTAIRRPEERTRAITLGGLFLIGYLLPFVVMKATLFSGLLNSYSQFSFDILLSPYTVLFGLYSIAVDSTYFLVGFGVFPVLYVALSYRSMPREERDLALFCLVSLAIGLAVVVFTISMREDVGHVALRQHLRYVAPLIIPLTMLFVKRVARLDPKACMADPHWRALAATLTFCLCLMVAFFFGSANLRQGFDNSQFHFMRLLLEDVEPLATQYFAGGAGELSAIAEDDGELLSINALNWLLRFAVIAFTALGMAFLLDRSQKVRETTGAIICAAITALMVANSAAGYLYNQGAYGAEPADVEEVCTINRVLEQNAGDAKVLIVRDDGNTKSNNLIDTYVLRGTRDYRYVKNENLDSYLERRRETNPETGDVAERFGYVLLIAAQKLEVVSGNVEQVAGTGDDGGRYLLYRVTDDEALEIN